MGTWEDHWAGKEDRNRRLKEYKHHDRQELLEFLGRIQILFTWAALNTQWENRSQSSNAAASGSLQFIFIINVTAGYNGPDEF